MFFSLYQHELEKAKVSDKTQSTRGASGQGNTAKLMAENEKLLKDLKKVTTKFNISYRACDELNSEEFFQCLFSVLF